jgi:hypothetical protein
MDEMKLGHQDSGNPKNAVPLELQHCSSTNPNKSMSHLLGLLGVVLVA